MSTNPLKKTFLILSLFCLSIVSYSQSSDAGTASVNGGMSSINISGSATLNLTTTATLAENEIIGWWFSGLPLSFADQTDVDAAIAAATIGGPFTTDPPNNIIASSSGTPLAEIIVDWDCTGFTEGDTYYATPIVSKQDIPAPTEFSGSTTNVNDFDGTNPGVTTIPVTVFQTPASANLEQVCLEITYAGSPALFDLDLKLVGPNGTSITLTSAFNGNGNLEACYVDDGSGDDVSQGCNTTLPNCYNGTLETETSFTTFDAIDPNGVWNLVVTDDLNAGFTPNFIHVELLFDEAPFELVFPTVTFSTGYLGTAVQISCGDVIPCPVGNTVADDNATVCSGAGTGSIADWQTAINTNNPLDINQDPGGMGQIVYSSVTPTVGGDTPDGFLPTGTTLGTDFCIIENQTTAAYLYCDADNGGTINAGDSYTFLSTFTLTVYPEIQTPTVVDNGCGFIVTGACPGDIITLSNPSLPTGVITNNGTNAVTYTAMADDPTGTIDIVIVSGIPGSPCSFSNNINTPACVIECPDPVTVTDGTGVVCDDGGVDDLLVWKQEVEDANPLDANSEIGNLAELVYSTVTPVHGSVGPDFKFPTGSFDGTDFCAPELQSISAYLYCKEAGSESYALLSTYTLTVYPPVPVIDIIEDGSNCGNPTVVLRAQDGTICASLMGTCATNAEGFNYDFSTTNTGLLWAAAPEACALPTGSIPCSGCRSISLIDDPCSCDDPMNVFINGDYYFHEVIEINALAGQNWNLTEVPFGQLFNAVGQSLTYPLPMTDNGNGIYTISVYVRNGVGYNAEFEEDGGEMLEVDNDCSLPSPSVACPVDTELGTFSCATLNNIPDCPITIAEAAAAPYNLIIDETTFCNNIVIICNDSETPDVCEGDDYEIDRDITVFDDLNGNGILDSGEPSRSCSFSYIILIDETDPIINEMPTALDIVIELTNVMGACPEDIYTGDIEDHLVEDPITGYYLGTIWTDPVSGMTWVVDAPTGIDNCGMTFTDLVDDNDDDDDCSITIILTWEIVDPCGNNSDEYIQTITFVDAVAPLLTAPANDKILSCSSAMADLEFEDWLDAHGGAEAEDNCYKWDNDYDGLGLVGSSCAASKTVIFTASDDCGHEVSTTATFTVADNMAPMVVNPAGNNMLTCFQNTPPIANTLAEFQSQGGTVSDDCSSTFSLVRTQSITGDFCPNGNPYTVSRSYLLTDECGNTGVDPAGPQVFQYLESQSGPLITNVLPTCYKYCAFNLNPMETDITYTTDCNLGATVNITGPVVIGQQDCPGTINRFTYTVTDACGRTATATRDFIIGNNGPTIYAPAFNLILECGNPNNSTYIQTHLGLASANSSCGQNVTVTYTPTNFDNLLCGNGTVVVFTATDACGRTATASTTIALQDNVAPEFTVVPPSICDVINCSADVAFWYNHWLDYMIAGFEATDACDTDVSISAFNTSLNTSCENGEAITVVTFVATDNCGNSTTATGTFTIENNPPFFSNVPAEKTIDCGEAPVFDPPTIGDDCSMAMLDFEDFYMGDNCTGMVIRTWLATDACGSTTTAVSIINFSDSPTPDPVSHISGTIATEFQQTVSDVEVGLEGLNGLNLMEVTEADGSFEFSNLELNSNVSVSPFLDDNPLNGVSTYDLVLIAKHILQTQLLDSPYKIIAADVNRSGSVTTFDMVELRKLILFIEEDFSNNTSWRFVEGDYVFPNPANPFATIFPEEVLINGLEPAEIHDFIAVKIGDVNNSAIANALLEIEARNSKGTMIIEASDRALIAGEEYEVAFRAGVNMPLSGFQFSLNFDPAQVAFVEMKKGELKNCTESNFGFSKLNEGGITSSWYSDLPVDVEKGAALFKMKFKAKTNVRLSEVLHINSRFTKAEAYDADLNHLNIELHFNTSKSSNNTFALYPNRPNPFSESTIIGFHLPNAGSAMVRVYDPSGRTLFQIDTTFKAGYNEVEIQRDQLSASGLLYYQLVADGFEMARKMVVR